MNIVHLTASPFFGRPERQMLGLAQALPRGDRTIFLSFPERGLCRPFLDEARRQGFDADALEHNTPHVAAAARELARRLREVHADVLCCHGYKSDIVGVLAARQHRVPIVAVARGWTKESWRVRFYEWLDRLTLPRMDAVVCVSQAQARRVAKAGVRAERLHVIRNAIRTERFALPFPSARGVLQSLFTRPRSLLIGAAGRLSPEKGFDILVEAAAAVVRACPSAGFVLFGEGRRRAVLADQIARLGLADHFVLAGFRDDLDGLLTGFDLTVLPSYTEGLPNVVLESLAAGVPVVATAVGGTPEVVENSVNGYLVPPGQPGPLAERILAMLGSEELRARMGLGGQRQVRDHFTFAAQARHYQALFETLVPAAQREVEPARAA